MTQNSPERTQNQIISLMEDPLVKILLENSQLSETQLETFLINILAEDAASGKLNFQEKAKLRKTNARISRGAFNRSLRQGERNITRSLNTILLLGYLGLLESPRLQPYVELSNKLDHYVKAYSKLWERQKKEIVKENKVEEVLFLKKELENGLKELTTPKRAQPTTIP